MLMPLLEKKSNFRVNATKNWDDSIRDAFITSLCSNFIRQCLLENRSLDINTTVNQARSLYIETQNLIYSLLYCGYHSIKGQQHVSK